MDKTSVVGTWTIVGQLYSGRGALPGETIAAFAFEDDTGVELERVVLTPTGRACNRWGWPFHFSALINSQAAYMRSGVQNADGTFTGQWSQSLNSLWRNDNNVRLFTTACDLSNWTEVETLRSSRDLRADRESSVLVTVQSADGKQLYESLTFRPRVDRNTQYLWVADICQFINRNSLFIRAGEKNSETQFFACINSAARNKFWIPAGSKLKVSYEIVETAKPVDLLRNGDNDLLPDMTGFEPDSLGVADNRWVSPGYLLADRDLAVGEKLRAWLIQSADGKPLANVEFTADASNRLQAKWPCAFAKAITAGAKQLTAGGWTDDGQFGALEGSASGAQFAKMDLAGKATINRLWHYSDTNRAFTTAAFANNWVKALSLDTEDLDAADTFWVQVRDLSSQYLYETHIFTPTGKNLTPAVLTKALCDQINRDGKMLRAGVLNTKTTLIAPGASNNALWIPQCSDLAVTLMPVTWWSQTTIKATRDLQEGESIYCYVWDDFSNVELAPPLCFTPKTAAERKSTAWLRAWAAAIKASPLAPYVRLGSSVPSSNDPGENATQATLWQIGAPLRVFTTEPSPDNWMSATGPLADLYETDATSVKIQLRSGLVQGVLRTFTFRMGLVDAIPSNSHKDLWSKAFYNGLSREPAYMRVGEIIAVVNEGDLNNAGPVPMVLWVPQRSEIVVEVERFSGELLPKASNSEMLKVEGIKYMSTEQILERALVATVIAVGGIANATGNMFGSLSRTVRYLISLELWASIDGIFESKIRPIFNLDIPEAENLDDPYCRESFARCVIGFIEFRSETLLVGGGWDQRIEVLSNDSEIKAYISKYEMYLREAYDFVFSMQGRWGNERKALVETFDNLLISKQIVIYWKSETFAGMGGLSSVRNFNKQGMPMWFELAWQANVNNIRVRSIYSLWRGGDGVLIEFHVPEGFVSDEPFIVGRIGQVSSDKIWSSGRALSMTFHNNTLAIPDSPLCADYGNTYRSEVFDVSGQNTTGVDPRTGLFNAHYPLAVLMGMDGKGPLWDLTLHYSALRANEAGLGDGWAFNFSSYETRTRLITLSTGHTIELTAADITKLRNKTPLNNRHCRISSTFRTGGDPKITDSIETLTLEFPSGAKEELSLPEGDTEEPFAEIMKTMVAKLNEAKAQMYKAKDQDKPQRNSTAGIVGEVFSWFVGVGPGITARNTMLYNIAWEEWEMEWAEKLPELIGPIDKEIAYWQFESRQYLPSTITSAVGGSLQLQWARRKGQFLLTNVSSNGKTLLTGKYNQLPDADGNKLNEVAFSAWPGTDEAYDIKLSLQNYLLKSIVRSDKSSAELQKVSYGYAGDPTLDRVLTSIEESDGSLEVVFYEPAAMAFPSWLMDKPPLPRVTRHIVQPGVGQASLITHWTYSSNNYLGVNSSQTFSRLDDAAVKEGAKYVYDSTATEDDGIAITRSWNGLHLQVKEQETAPSGASKTTEWGFAKVDPASPQFGLVETIKTTYQESDLAPAKESTK
jgi:hypothetical protein